jgi:hypothetical protein
MAASDSKKHRRDFSKRPQNKISLRPVFYIAAEGKETECHYFETILRDIYNNITIKTIKHHGNDPKSLQKAIEKTMANLKGVMNPNLHAWVVVDRDQWKEEDFDAVAAWTKKSKNRGLALSNPCFEFWLLMHFQPYCPIHDSRDCLKKLLEHIPDYDKKLSGKIKSFFVEESIVTAIKNAKECTECGGRGWPEKTGTTVYLLVEKILSLHAAKDD